MQHIPHVARADTVCSNVLKCAQLVQWLARVPCRHSVLKCAHMCSACAVASKRCLADIVYSNVLKCAQLVKWLARGAWSE